MSEKTLFPEVVWAQRSDASDPAKNILYLTIKAANIPTEDLTLKLTPTNLSYSGKTTKGVVYAVEIPFFEEIDPAESRHSHSLRGTDCVLRKKEPKEAYWPRLLKDKARLHWLHTDFDKWVDEDEQEGAPEEAAAGMDPSMMSQFGGGDDAGGFGGIDFSKLGGAGGMGGMPGGMDMASMMQGMGGMGGPGGAGMEGLEEDSGEGEDDDEMPGLEEEKEPTTAAAVGATTAPEGKTTAAGGKIEEL